MGTAIVPITRRRLLTAAGAALLAGSPRRPVLAQDALRTLQPVDKFEPADGYFIQRMALAPDGKTLLVVCQDDSAVLWDLGGRKPARSLPGPETLDAQFVGDGRRAVTVSGKNVILWDTADARMLRTLALNGDDLVVPVATHDGRVLAIGQGSTLSLWDVDSGRRLAEREAGTGGRVERMSLSPDGRWLAVRFLTMLRLFAMPALTPGAEWDFRDYLGAAVFSADSQRLLLGEKEQVALYDLAGKQLARVPGPTQALFAAVALLRDGDTFIAGNNWDDIWRFGSLGKGGFVAQTDALKVAGVALSPDHRRAYVGGGGTVYTFDLAGVSKG